MIRLTIILLFFFLATDTYSQSKYTISGFIEDQGSGEKLIAANIFDSKTFNGKYRIDIHCHLPILGNGTSTPDVIQVRTSFATHIIHRTESVTWVVEALPEDHIFSEPF